MDTKNMRALLINVLLGIAIIAAAFAAIGGGWSIAKYTGFLPLKKAKKALVIDETPITIEQVKAIGQLVTATYYDEAVSIVRKARSRENRNEDWVYALERVPEDEATAADVKGTFQNLGHLVLVQKMHVRIGVDFAELTPDALEIDEEQKSVSVKLPALKRLDTIMNPSDTEVFFQEGDNWDLDDLKKAVKPAETEMLDKMAADQALFDKARQGAREVVAQLFRAAGYENVTVTFASTQNPVLPAPPVE